LLTPSSDAWLATFLERKARAIDCELLAAGNAADHVHVAVRLAPRVSIASLAHHLKGASSRAIGLQYRTERLWQAGYWAESFAHRDLPPLLRYIRDQRAHHAEHTEAEPWEASAP